MSRKHPELIPFFVSIIIFLLILMFVVVGTPNIDSWISQQIISFWNNSPSQFLISLDYYLQGILIGIAVIAILLLFVQKRKKESLILFISLICGYVLEQIIKFIVQRPRPSPQLIQELSYSFPSGHSIFAIILFSALIYFYKSKIKNAFFKTSFVLINILLILFVGFSRIYLNVHWLTDVVGGFALGFVILTSVLFLILDK